MDIFDRYSWIVALILFIFGGSATSAQTWVDHYGSSTGGGISNSAGRSTLPKVAIGQNGEIAVAYQDNTSSVGDVHVYLKRSLDSAWSGYGGSDVDEGIDDNPTEGRYPSVAFDSQNRILISYRSHTQPYYKYLNFERWNGTGWEILGASAEISGSSSPNSVDHTVVIPANNDDPVVLSTWGIYPTSAMKFQRFSGSNWSSSGADGPSYFYSPSIAVDSTGEFWIVAGRGSENLDVSSVRLWRYGGANWPIVSTLFNREVGKRASIAVDSQDRPVVAYMAGNLASGVYDVFVARWDGSGWTEFASSNSGSGISNPSNHSGSPSLVLGDDGFPIVAFIEHSSNGNWIRVRKFNGTSWVEFGTGSNSEPGLGNNASKAVVTDYNTAHGGDNYPAPSTVSLARNDQGQFFCVWEDTNGDNIYGKLFDPTPNPVSAPNYIYDDVNRLTNVNISNGIRIAYDYDSSGNRAQKEVTSQLIVTSGTQNPEFSGAATSEVNAPMLQMTLQVNPEEDVIPDFIVLQTSGSGDESTSLTDARLWLDANSDGIVDGGDTQIGLPFTDFSDNGEVVFQGLSQVLTASSSTDLLVTYTFDGTPALDDSFKLDLINRQKIGATGTSTSNSIFVLGTPVSGSQVTISNDNTPPTFSGLDTAVGVSGSVQLDWTAAVDAAGSTPITYRIWQSTSTFGGTVSGEPDYSTTNTTFPVTGLVNGQPYYFVVRAEDSVGNRELNTTERTATPQATTYALAVASTNGIALPLPPTGTYNAGSVVSLEASPDAGYSFTGWSGDVPGGQEMDNPLDLTMNTNKNLTATFASAVGTVQVDTTPDVTPTWSFHDSSGMSHPGTGDVNFAGNIPTGGLEMTWTPLAGYLTPKSNPTIDALAKDGTVTFTGVYIPELTITAQPQPLKRYIDEAASFSVTTTGGDGIPHHVWKFDDGQNPPVAVGGNVSNLQLSNLALTQDGTYLCEITDDYPDTKISNAVTLEVAEHLSITQHPLGAQLGAGNSQMFTVATTGGVGVLSYQWEKDGVIIPGATSYSYTIMPLDLDDAGSYNVTISDTHTDVIESNSAILTVQPLPVAVPIAEMLWLLVLISLLIPMAIIVLSKWKNNV